MDNSPPSRPTNFVGPRQKPQRTQVFSPDTSLYHLLIVIEMRGPPTDGIRRPIVLAATSVDRRFGGSSQTSNVLDRVTTLHWLVSNAMSEDGHTLHFYSLLICLLWVNHALAIQPQRHSLSVVVQSHLKWCVAAKAVMCHVWTAPAVQGKNLTFERSVRVQPCIRPFNATAVAAGPDVIR